MKPQERFSSEGQRYFGPRENPLTETHCNVWDWDRLRMVKVKGTAKLFPPDEDKEVPILAQFADYLSPEARAVTVDDDGLLMHEENGQLHRVTESGADLPGYADVSQLDPGRRSPAAAFGPSSVAKTVRSGLEIAD
ncbi:hypothetical protein P175DRAFT_0531491 [Aspergillus ochraceoroseus IBT 24754]|uniref:Uncharacterized protein n=1 Tax=Aspergillus ochraceoroseus IBT 24754 TaxID=1392256 RepID=A0A2T5M093_9EURO|nr:uncharacterized protein P175DRAFT_0531491 [Aspergillus ochraceoroseus IBT 24754]PTU21950.1 hypothetical protein P175DRAFT_0531491 [Aspergillus ochraceoroseus IBT 24754]